MLKKFKDMSKALGEASKMKEVMQEVQKELEKTVISISELNDQIKIEISGELVVNKVEIAPALLQESKKSELEKGLNQAMNKAIKQAKDLATNKLQSVTGGLFGG